MAARAFAGHGLLKRDKLEGEAHFRRCLQLDDNRTIKECNWCHVQWTHDLLLCPNCGSSSFRTIGPFPGLAHDSAGGDTSGKGLTAQVPSRDLPPGEREWGP